MEEKPENTKETGRNPDGTWKKGFCPNPGGRPKGGLKDYDRRKFVEMSDEEKEEFLKGISAELRYKMAEGNPATNTDITSGGDKIIIMPSELIDKNDTS